MKKIVILLIFMIFLTGCKDIKKEEIEKFEMVTFLHYFSESLDGGINEMISEFNDQSKDVKVKAISIDHESYKVNVLNEISSDNSADLYSYWAGSKTEAIVSYLEPITDIFDGNDLNNVFSSQIIESACSYNGEIYLMPITQHYVSFFYNKTLFDKYDLKVPKTWDDFLIVAKQLKNHDVTPFVLGNKNKWPAQFWFDYLLLETAGYEYREKLINGDASYTDKEVLRVFEMWKELIDLGLFNEDVNEIDWSYDVVKRMNEGSSAMTLMGTWLLPILEESFTESEYGYFSFPMINPDISRSALGPIDGIVIPRKSKLIDSSKSVITYFSRKESQVEMSVGSGGFSPNKDVDQSIYTDIQKKMLNDISEKEHWAFNYDLAAKEDVFELGLKLFYDFLQVSDIYKELLENMESQIN